MSDKRRSPRLLSAAKVLWQVQNEDAFQVDRVENVSQSGAFIVTQAVPRRGSILELEMISDSGETLCSGTARVIWVNPGQGMGVDFENLTLDAETIASIAPAPPPLPGARPASWKPPENEAFIQPISIMPGKGGAIIGIDLGTTHTCVAAVVDGKARILPGETGGNFIPSMVHFDPEGEIYVGERALGRRVLHPERTVHGSKRLLGRTYRESLREESQPHFAYPLAQAEGQRFGVTIGDRVVSMDEIATHVLRNVKQTASKALGTEVAAAVITVPAYFSEVQRDAVRRAAEAADLMVHRVVNEPTAAAVAYGAKRGEDATIAVWDFGGGTFDLSIVEVRGETFRVLGTGGDNFVGGEDMDDLLASYVLTKHSKGDYEPSAQQIARLQEAARDAKHMLTAQTEVEVHLPSFDAEGELRVELSREEFEQLIEPLIARTIQIAEGVLGNIGIEAKAVDDVVLVGGSTRIPKVQETVGEFFGRRASKRINPDEAVALGAGMLADELSNTDGPTLLDIVPITIGQAIAGRRFAPVIPKLSRLPHEAKLTRPLDLFGTLLIPLFQGEANDATQNEYIGTLKIEDERYADQPVDITISLDEHCVLAVTAHTQEGNAVTVEMDREQPVDEVLAELGIYSGPEDDAPWRLPQSKLGNAFSKFASLFRGKK